MDGWIGGCGNGMERCTGNGDGLTVAIYAFTLAECICIWQWNEEMKRGKERTLQRSGIGTNECYFCY
jgi:hypothetical protein